MNYLCESQALALGARAGEFAREILIKQNRLSQINLSRIVYSYTKKLTYIHTYIHTHTYNNIHTITYIHTHIHTHKHTHNTIAIYLLRRYNNQTNKSAPSMICVRDCPRARFSELESTGECESLMVLMFSSVDSIWLVENGFNVMSFDASDKMLKYALKTRWERRKEPAFDAWGKKRCFLHSTLAKFVLEYGFACITSMNSFLSMFCNGLFLVFTTSD